MYMFSIAAVLIICSYFYMVLIRKTFMVDLVYDDDPVYAGDTRKFELSVDSALPLPYLSVAAENEFKNFIGELESSIRLSEKFWYEKEIKFISRGIYNPGVFSVSGEDTFSLFKIYGFFDLNRKLKVYPACYKIRKLNKGGQDIFQEISDINSTIENPYQIKDIRKYQNGDSLKRVHWKLSAKHMHLLSKNHDSITGQGFSVIADMNVSNYSLDATGETEELLIDGLVSLLYKIFDSSTAIKIMLNKKVFQQHEIISASSLREFIEHLIVSRSDGEESFSRFFSHKIKILTRINLVAVLSASLKPELSGKIIEAAGSGYSISVFYCVNDSTSRNQAAVLRKHRIKVYNFHDILEKKDSGNDHH
ncbi:MAG: DUF58 domain-containing protein [Spirochaetes bacterium]|nr:DUF58 domain-containing protein [Spirochaetota bacterium]